MNVFRFLGDMSHLFSVLVLLLKVYATKSCSGLSRKTQELYLLAFVARYLDLFGDYISLYNSVMKAVFINSSAAIVWYMRRHPQVRRTYDKEQDIFPHYVLVAAAFVLAVIFNEEFAILQICWAFSIYLEAVAIVPQWVLLQRYRNIDNNMVGKSVFFLLGVYRVFYIMNWTYLYFIEGYHSGWILWIGGLVQTVLNAYLCSYYILRDVDAIAGPAAEGRGSSSHGAVTVLAGGSNSMQGPHGSDVRAQQRIPAPAALICSPRRGDRIKIPNTKYCEKDWAR